MRALGDEVVMCVANLARTVQPVELDLSRFKGMTPVEMLGLTEFPRIGDLPYFLTLPGYSFYWFRLQQAPSPIAARVVQESVPGLAEMPALFVGAAWDTVLEGNVRTLIERDLLTPFLQRQRWFGGKAREPRASRFVDWGLLRRGPQPLFLTVVEVDFKKGDREHYFLPLAISAAPDGSDVEARSPQTVLARVTGAKKGVLFDASLDTRFAETILEAMDRQEETTMKRGRMRAQQTSLFSSYRGQGALRITHGSAEQSNTSIIYGDRLIVKLFRRLEPGVNPDYEIGRYLTEQRRFSRVPGVAGDIHFHFPAEEPTTVAMMQQLVESQADGWRHATEELSRFYDRIEGRDTPREPLPKTFADMIAAKPPLAVVELMTGYLETALTLGRRTGELHLALASDARDAAFAPEPFTKEDLVAVSAEATAQVQQAMEALQATVDRSAAERRRVDCR